MIEVTQYFIKDCILITIDNAKYLQISDRIYVKKKNGSTFLHKKWMELCQYKLEKLMLFLKEDSKESLMENYRDGKYIKVDKIKLEC